MRCNCCSPVVVVICVFANAVAAAATPPPGARGGDGAASDQITHGLAAADQVRREDAVASIRAMLLTNPGTAVDKLNSDWLPALLRAGRTDEVLDLSRSATLTLPADTWRVEQLYVHRVKALLKANRPAEAVTEAKALVNVAGLGFTMRSLDLLGHCLRAAHPEDPGIANRLKLQVLAGASTDAAERQVALAAQEGLILSAIALDPAPWEEAIASRERKTEYRTRYGTANLLLLAGRTQEARALFHAIWASRPPGEDRYAAEGVAKAIRADTGTIGAANEWIRSVN